MEEPNLLSAKFIHFLPKIRLFSRPTHVHVGSGNIFTVQDAFFVLGIISPVQVIAKRNASWLFHTSYLTVQNNLKIKIKNDKKKIKGDFLSVA